MQITVTLPDELARKLAEGGDLSRAMLEAYAAEAYRTEQLSRHQVGELLGLDRWQTEEFLSKREALRPYTLADWSIDRRALERLKAG